LAKLLTKIPSYRLRFPRTISIFIPQHFVLSLVVEIHHCTDANTTVGSVKLHLQFFMIKACLNLEKIAKERFVIELSLSGIPVKN